MLLLFLFSFFVALNLEVFHTRKENAERELLAKRLASDQDISSEMEFLTLSKKLDEDDYLRRIIVTRNVMGISEFKENMERRFFNGFWERYDSEFYLYDNAKNSLINYANAVVIDFEQNITGEKKMPFTIQTETRMLYNPQLKGAYNFVPGVMAMVLLLVCTMMTALTVVREKELGTMEVMLESPLKQLKIIIAKAVPYLLLSMLNIASILLLSVFVLDVPINGSLTLLVGESILFILVALSLGLLISSSTASQQSAMFISLIGMFLPTVMLSGFMFPIENMPLPMQVVSNAVPAKWFYIIVRSVMIKGVGLKHVWKETLILSGMLIFFMTMAIKKFKVRLA
jgi:ABC-2 type transport system permease protein